MADFNIAIEKTLRNEGGDKFTETPNDNGGATKYGISLRFLASVYDSPDELKKAKGTIIERLFIRPPTRDTIRYLTECEAKYIYKLYFWDRNRYGEIRDQAISEKVFDLSVLFGAPWAVKTLQRTLGIDEEKVDGIVGPFTIRLTNERTSNSLISELQNMFTRNCLNICNKKRDQDRFLLGWLNRVMS